MSKNRISIFFSIIFIAFIAAPTVITIVDDSVDVSIIFSTAEEEEKGFKIVFSNEKANESDLAFTSSENNLGYYFKNYPKPHLNLISPPPEFIS
ncbi:hypothetical protein [Hwangdonia lutea]|uniref:Uncharacterized protein n=1 Tax=Hwangdonia lutea TaxID=3075823 RepID=A0AA97ERW8_9FLAO|nr:hypothetical protein [Hwangdonia sp. SCSIO 19198]WOD45130.1 hypothetical protein RNZ46_07640 [Hwangdonia sp. SCSIO 19198]